MPFGGTKMSGIGREGIRFALEALTESGVVCLAPTHTNLSMWFYFRDSK